MVVAYPPSHPLFAEVVTALDDLERPGFVTRIRHLRQIKTPLGLRTEQITNAYRAHEPTSACSQWPCLLASPTLGHLALT